MSYYKKLFNNKLKIAGSSKGAKPAFMQPPDGTFSKVGYQIYEVLDLICEGPVQGLTNQKGLILEGSRATKDFNSDLNVVGSNTNGVDKGIYYNDNQLRTEGGDATYGKYDINFIPGEEFQDAPKIIRSPRRLIKINQLIKGPYDMSGPLNGARTGKGSRDVRRESNGSSDHKGENLSFLSNPFDSSSYFGLSTEIIADDGSRDFVNWQNFVPAERDPKPYYHNNYDKNITKLDVSLKVNALHDSRTASSKNETESGSSKMGNHTPLTITFEITVGKVDKVGNQTIAAASFTTRSGKGVTLGQGNGRVAVSGIVTSPYHISLEGIALPTLDDDDLYNFIKIRKLEFETYSSVVKREGGVGNIVEIIEENLMYPNSTMVESSVDAKYFPQIPARTFRLKGKKVLIPSNYFPIEDNGKDRRFCNVQEIADGNGTYNNIIYSGDWDGTFKFGWTDNPAWIFYDLLVNTRYGIGAYLQDVNIVDKWSLYEMGMYCDAVSLNDGGRPPSGISGAGRFVGLNDGFGGLEPRFSMNVYMSDQVNAYEALQDFAKGFMATTYYNDSVVNVRMDKPHFFQNFNRNDAFEDAYSNTTDYINPPKELKFPPHLIFNNNNVVDGKFAYSDVDKGTKHNSVEVSYLDKRNNYTAKTEYAEDSDSIKKVGLNYHSVDGLGITSRGQASRLARAIVFEANNTTEKVSFAAALEALLIEPGDIIQVDDELKNFTKNFGTIIGTSGSAVYYDPDGTGASESNLKTGIGPKVLIAQPSIRSNQLSYVTGGNINIINPLGQSGIDAFYNNTSADNELYKDIHQPQVISLQLASGGSGLTYKIIDNHVHFNIENLKFFGSTFERSSQWFSEKSANILHGASYSIDASGRSPKYYRVLGISENYDNGFNVSALIHHTGKYKFIEENVAFDANEDAFEPELRLSDILKPNPPQLVTTGVFAQQSDNSLTLPLTITHASSNPGDRFAVVIEEPNTNTVGGTFGISNSSTTNIVLQDNQKIDQIGTYTVNVFSEFSSSNVRNTTPATISFTTNVNNFGFNATNNALIEYNDIELNTRLANEYSAVGKTGSGVNSFLENDENINAVFDLEFKNFFGVVGNSILDEVSGQKINLLNSDGVLVKENFKTLTNEKQLTITNSDLNSGFQYTGDGRFIVPPGIDFEINKFTLAGTETSTSTRFVDFEDSFSEKPAVFVSQVVTEIGNDKRKIGMVEVSTSGFSVTGASANGANFNYIASKTGIFHIDNRSKKIIVGSAVNNGASGYTTINFGSTFDTVPSVVVQLQNPDKPNGESYFCETVVKDVTENDFKFVGFQPNGSNPSGTGIYAFIATESENFNINGSNSLPTECLNYAASISGSSFAFADHTVLDNINKNSNSNFRFNHNQSAIFPQRVGENSSMEDKSIAVYRIDNQNKLALHYLDKSNDGSGMFFTGKDPSSNYIYITGANQPHDLTGDFTLETWAKFSPNLTGKQYLFDSVKSGSGTVGSDPLADWTYSDNTYGFFTSGNNGRTVFNGVTQSQIFSNAINSYYTLNAINFRLGLYHRRIEPSCDLEVRGFFQNLGTGSGVLSVDSSGFNQVSAGTSPFNMVPTAVGSNTATLVKHVLTLRPTGYNTSYQAFNNFYITSGDSTNFSFIIQSGDIGGLGDNRSLPYTLEYNAQVQPNDDDASLQNLRIRFGEYTGVAAAHNTPIMQSTSCSVSSASDTGPLITGIGWFQSGDGKNYLQMMGKDFEASTTNLNDGLLHNIKLVVDRKNNLKTYIDGSLDKTNTGVVEFTGFNLYADTGYNLLSPMKLNAANDMSGLSLHQGGIFHYLGFFTGQVTGDYTDDPNGFASAFSGDIQTAFLIKTGQTVVDLNGNDDGRNNTVGVVGNLSFDSEDIDQSSITSNVNFIQISSTGTL